MVLVVVVLAIMVPWAGCHAFVMLPVVRPWSWCHAREVLPVVRMWARRLHCNPLSQQPGVIAALVLYGACPGQYNGSRCIS